MAIDSCGCPGQICEKLQPVPVNRASIPTLSTRLSWRDVVGAWAVRWGIGRMRYKMDPGLYRVGEPDSCSPILVTSNYKLTVDALRTCLIGLNVWLVILDTDGVNVWCAAGKGTFGTAELVSRVEQLQLKTFVEHRRLILPQLAATGVVAHEVKRATGFTVQYGPVRARDLARYLADGMTATPEMRRVVFGWKDRLVLAPMELISALKPGIGIMLFCLAMEALQHRTLSWKAAWAVLPILVALLVGGLLVPLVLPFLPTRVFAVKGAIAGTACAVGVVAMTPMGHVEAIGIALLAIAITSYMAMMFTGASTFTNLAGVRLEVKWALPVIAVVAASGALIRAFAVFL